MFDPDSELEARYRSVVAPPDWYQTNIPCQVGCPAHTDVSTYIGLISPGSFRRSVPVKSQMQYSSWRAGAYLRATMRAGLPPQQN